MTSIPILSWQLTPIWQYWLIFATLIFFLIPCLQRKEVLLDAVYACLLPINTPNNGNNVKRCHIQAMVLFAVANVTITAFYCFFPYSDNGSNYVVLSLLTLVLLSMKTLLDQIIFRFSQYASDITLCAKNSLLMFFLLNTFWLVNTIIYINTLSYPSYVIICSVFFLLYFIAQTVQILKLYKGQKKMTVIAFFYVSITQSFIPITLFVFSRSRFFQ